MKTEPTETLQHELRLAQLEIKMLREQLAASNKQIDPIYGSGETPVPPLDRTPQAENIVPLKPPATPAAKTNGSREARVLYVEDSEPNFRLVESILFDRPMAKITWASTAGKGLEMARESKPELILLDLDLPDMHGSKLLELIQAEPAIAHTPVIVISADATPSQIERMLSAGARNYLTKPFEIRRFLYMFDEVFAPAAA